MKRKKNLYEKIYSLQNLLLADARAQKGKGNQYGVQQHNKNWAENLLVLHDILKQKQYRTSAYTTFTIHEPKERVIYRLPYFPDRITHHAVMNVLEPIFINCFTVDTYSCIKGKGIHAAQRALRNALKDKEATEYCLKLDIRKFYPTINHGVLKTLLRRKFKDEDLLWLLDEIIDSTEGLPIGNYLSQYFANFYLTYFDHWIKEQQKVKHYFRYADDIVILAADKPQLHQLLADMRTYFEVELNLEIKDNYQIFPVSETKGRGIDFVGYVFYHTHTRLRKSIKQNCARKIKKGSNDKTKAAYNGWFSHADCINLNSKLLAA